jgi:hypothetical protein
MIFFLVKVDGQVSVAFWLALPRQRERAGVRVLLVLNQKQNQRPLTLNSPVDTGEGT